MPRREDDRNPVAASTAKEEQRPQLGSAKRAVTIAVPEEHGGFSLVGDSGVEMSVSDWRFYGFVAGCLIAAALLLALLVDGEVVGPQVAEVRHHLGAK